MIWEIRNLLAASLLLCLLACGAGDQSPNTGIQPSRKSQAAAPAPNQSDYYPVVQQLYLGYFGRPADPGGLAYFAGMYRQAGAPINAVDLSAAYDSNATVKALVDSFGESTESNQLYSGDTTAFVTAIYGNLLGRAPDATGLSFWVSVIDRKLITRANAVLSIMAGAQGSDLELIHIKRTAAATFTEALTTPDLLTSYSGMEANAVVRKMLAKVNSASSASDIQAYITQALATLAIMPRKGAIFPPVEGLYFRTASASGYLDRTGEFTYSPGDQVSLSVGGVEVASMPAGIAVTLFELDNAVRTTNLARVIKALDTGTGGNLAVPTLPTTTLIPADLSDDTATSNTLASINAQAVLPAANNESVSAMVSSATLQATVAAGSAGGTYSYFDSTLGEGYNSFLGNGMLQSCSTSIPRVTSGSVSLTSAPNWTARTMTGSAKLMFSDGSSAEFAINAMKGSFQRSGKSFEFEFQRTLSSYGRIQVLSITDTASNGGTYKCNIENVVLRDNARPNQPPHAVFQVKWPIRFADKPHIYEFQTDFHNWLTAAVPSPERGLSRDPDGRLIRVTWHSSKGNRSATYTPARYGSNINSFSETVSSNERVTITLTVEDDQGAKTSKVFVINPEGLALEDILKLLNGKTYLVKEGDYSYYYRLNSDNTVATEWELISSTGECAAESFKVGDFALGIDISKISFTGGDFSYTDADGYTTRFTQTGAVPSKCASAAVKPPPATPTPPPVVIAHPDLTSCEFMVDQKCIVNPPLGFIGVTTPPGDKSSKDDVCETWQVIGYPVQFSSCSYASGQSGYSIVRNNGPTAAICWKINWKTDKPDEKGCNSSLPGGEAVRASCYSCNPKNAGVHSFDLTRYRTK